MKWPETFSVSYWFRTGTNPRLYKRARNERAERQKKRKAAIAQLQRERRDK